MANKRMFTMKICDSDAFLDMPLSTQCLYFHLNMRADDDGFIGNPKRIQKIIGASEDDLKLLIAKRFVLAFEDGVIVIKHWRMHNTIQSDRYTPTVYQEEKESLMLKANKSYSLTSGTSLETKCFQNVSADIDIDKDIDSDLDLDSVQGTGKGTGKGKSKKPAVFYPADEALNQAFLDYIDARKKMKKPMTDRAIQLAMNELDRLAGDDNDLAIKILNQSIFKGWLGLFPLKEDKQTNNTASDYIDMWRDA